MLILFQAAQATFKSIKAVVPLLDRVLVQRFKAETVCCALSRCAEHRAHVVVVYIENRNRHFPPYVDN